MVQRPGSGSSFARILAAFVSGALSAFFVFYTVRLLVVTHGLHALRAGGRGAYAGAVVFPLLAVVFAWCAWRVLHPPRHA
jgi:hypothetical protein